MQYPIFIHKDKKSDYGTIVPDLPGCYSAGSTMEETINNACEAIECHLEGLIKDNEPIPAKKPLDQHLNSSELDDSILAIVDIDITKISGKSKRIDITIPNFLLKQLDRYIKTNNISSRSEFLVTSAMSLIFNQKEQICTKKENFSIPH